MKKIAKKTTITQKIIDQAEMLAGKAYSIGMIADALGIAYGTCFNNGDLSEAIKRGQANARQKVIDALMLRADADQSSTAAIFLAKQLKVFESPFTTETPKTIADTITRIGDIYEAVSEGRLDRDKGDRLVGYLDKLLKGMELSELEKRLKTLEDKANGK